jgi:hypothetical protein
MATGVVTYLYLMWRGVASQGAWLISYQEEFGYLNFEYIEAVSTRTLDYLISDRLILNLRIDHPPTKRWVQLWLDGGKKRSPSNKRLLASMTS